VPAPIRKLMGTDISPVAWHDRDGNGAAAWTDMAVPPALVGVLALGLRLAAQHSV